MTKAQCSRSVFNQRMIWKSVDLIGLIVPYSMVFEHTLQFSGKCNRTPIGDAIFN